MAMKYRKKPVVVEAVQWTGENRAEMCEFIDPEVFEIIPRVGLVIHTLEGDHHASPGDYIIKGVNGEFYPCKPDIFAKTYESSTLTPPNEWVSVDERMPTIEKDYGGYGSVSVNVFNGKTVLPMDWESSVVRGKKVFRWKYPWGRIYDGTPITHWMPLPERPKEDE